MIVTNEQLLVIMPAAGDKAALYEPFLNAGRQEFGITTKQQVQTFLANLAVETGDLQRVSENLNYSADGLANTWHIRYAAKNDDGYVLDAKGRYKPNALAKQLAKNQEAIANNTYANREGNGDEASGDGWRHRGAGGFQITFKNNQARCAKFFKIPIEQIGEWLCSPEGAMRSAAWFYWQAGCAKRADAGDFDGVADLINIGRKTEKIGDAIGFAARAEKLKLAKKAIA